MTPALTLARSLYKAIREIEEVRSEIPHHHFLSDKRSELERRQEEAEGYLAQVLTDIKQWNAEP